MSAPIIWTGLAVFSLVFIYLAIIRPAQLAQVHVSLDEDKITKVVGHKRSSMNVTDISEVRYHYSAVAGSFSVWELIDEDGESFEIVRNAKGIDDVLPFFESTLPGFSARSFERQFELGDVEDTIDVWRRR